RFEDSGKTIAPAVSQTNRVEVERHFRTTRNAAATIETHYLSFDRRTVILARRSNRHREALAFANVLRYRSLLSTATISVPFGTVKSPVTVPGPVPTATFSRLVS